VITALISFASSMVFLYSMEYQRKEGHRFSDCVNKLMCANVSKKDYDVWRYKKVYMLGLSVIYWICLILDILSIRIT